MGEGFVQIKKKRLISAIVKAAICGVSCALFAVGIVLLPCKLNGINLHAGYYVLIAAAAAIIFGGIVFLVFNPTNKRLATELDVRYGLNEKVQTSLAFASEQGTIIQLQREDADAKLKSLPQPKLNFANLWQYFVIAIVSVALFFTAVFIPVDGDDPGGTPVYDPPYTLNEYDEEAVRELIANVNSSSLDDSLQSAVVDILNTMLNDLADATVESQMQRAVAIAMQEIDDVLRGSLSYLQLAVDFAHADVVEIAWINAKGMKLYRDYLLRDYEDVELFASESVDAITEATADWFEALKERIAEERAVVATNVYLALLGTRVSPDDGMYAVLNDLSNLLADDQADVTQSFVKFSYDLVDELAAQSYVLAVNRFVIDKLAVIFGVDAIDSVDYAPGEVTTDPNEGDDGNHQSQGGFGEGDVLYGSDDLVYDPDTGEYVPYGQLLNKLYAIVQERLRSGELTEEQANAITAYFEILFSGINEE